MNNLKRILSLALASVMVMGMMVVGASAVTFTDDEDIIHDAAVDTMAALNIIGGQPDGSFQPNGKVTRAQMAKMIAFALNGGKDPQVGTPLTSSFTDTTTHWAKEYIEYCANLGIIGGKGNGIFDPEGNVKANEAAKMILVALGFDADIFELGGPNWSTNTIRLATTLRVVRSASTSSTGSANVLGSEPLNLFDELAGVTAEAELTRDQAAQLIYNGIQSQTVVMALTGVTSGTQTGILGATEGNKPQYTWALTGPSILEDKFGAEMKEGVMTAAGYNSATKTFTYVLALPTPTEANPDLTTEKTFAGVEEDVTDLFMQKTRVIYTTNRDKSLNALSLTPAYHDVVSEGIVGNIQPGNRNATSGAYYSLDGYRIAEQAAVTALPVYEMLGDLYEGENYTNYTGRNVYDSYRLIDNDQDGMLDCMLIMPVTWGTVSYVGSTSVTINGIGSVSKAACYEGIAVGDVAVDTYDGIIKAELLTATIDGVNAKDQLIRANNTWIPYTETSVTNTIMDGKEHILTMVNGYVVAHRAADADAEAPDMFLVLNALDNPNTTLDGSTFAARVLTTEGKVRDITVNADFHSLIGQWVTATPATSGSTVLKLAAITDATDVGFVNMYTNVNWVAAVTGVPAALKGSYTDAAGSAATKNLNLADDAVVLIQHNDGSTTTNEAAEADNLNGKNDADILKNTVTITGKDVKAWNADFGETTNLNVAFTKTVGGIEYVTFLYMANKKTALPGAKASSAGYGYVITNANDMYVEKVGNVNTLVYQVWDGAENVTVHDTILLDNTLNAGKIISYTVNADGTVTRANDGNATSPTATYAYNAASIVGWNAPDGLLNFQKTDGTAPVEVKVDNDTVYLFIDSSKTEGVAGGAVAIAGKNDAGAYYANAILNTSKTSGQTLDLVVIDVNGAMKGVKAVAEKPAAKADATLSGMEVGKVYRLDENVTSGAIDFSGCNSDDVVVVTFAPRAVPASGDAGSQKYTLRIGTTVGGAQIYEEVATVTDGVGTAMWFDITGASNDGKGTWNLKNADGTKKAMAIDGSCYTWSIVGEDNVTYASGTFKLI